MRAEQILNARERVHRSTYEGEERQKTGRLMEKSVFETKFADQPEVLRRAVYQPLRVKEAGKYIVKQFTKIYDQEYGVYNFIEREGDIIEQIKDIDTGELVLSEDQQTRAFEQACGVDFSDRGSSRNLTLKDVDMGQPAASSFSASGAAASASGGGAGKRKRDPEKSDNSDDSDDLVSPLERMTRRSSAPKKKAQKKDPSTPVAIAAAALPGSTLNTTGVPAVILQLVGESKDALTTLRSCKSMSEVKEEQMVSLLSRLSSKKQSLGKKTTPSNINSLELINDVRNKVSHITELLKAVSTFEAKNNRPNARKVEDWQ